MHDGVYLGMLGGADSPRMRGWVKFPFSINASLSVGLTYRFVEGLLSYLLCLMGRSRTAFGFFSESGQLFP